MPPTVIAPTARLHAAWLEAHTEWGPGLHEDGFGLESTDDVESPEGFAAWIARLTAEPDRGTCRWIVEDERVQGGIALRHQFNERTGHIGYGIRPSARGRGLATWALGKMLDQARALNMDRVLLVCAGRQPCVRQDNRAQRRCPRGDPAHQARPHTAILDQPRRDQRLISRHNSGTGPTAAGKVSPRSDHLAGWGHATKHFGHLVGGFSHERINGDDIDCYITPGNDQPMRRLDAAGKSCHWILEIHITDRDRDFGGFHEQLLDI